MISLGKDGTLATAGQQGSDPSLNDWVNAAAEQSGAKGRPTSTELHHQLRTIVSKVQSISASIASGEILSCVYPMFCPIDVNRAQSNADAFSRLQEELSQLEEFIPERAPEFITLSREFRLRDIDQVLLFTRGLKRARRDTVWLHFELSVILNRLLNAGLTSARGPCLLHAFLAILHPGDAQENLAFAHSIIARELTSVAPVNALREGIRAIALGYSPAYESVLSAARSLQIGDGPAPSRPSTSFIRDLARAAELSDLGYGGPLTDSIRADLKGRLAVDGERRMLQRPLGDASYYMFRQAGSEVQLPVINVYEIPHGTISFDISKRGRTEFYVFNAAGECIEDLSNGIQPFISADREDVSGELAVIDDEFSGAFNVCHFLLDRLPRLAIYKKAFGYIPQFLTTDDFDYCKEILSLSGLIGRAHFAKSRRFSFRADQLLLSSNIREFAHPAQLGAEWALGFLRDLFRPHRPAAPHKRLKLFISRADTRVRNIINQSQVEKLMADQGYQTALLTGMPAREQIALFSAASDIVGVHGAGLTNALFCESGTNVIEILPPMVASRSYWILCTQLGHRYYSLVADDPELPRPDYRTWRHRAEYNSRNVIVELDRLREALDSMEHSTRTNHPPRAPAPL